MGHGALPRPVAGGHCARPKLRLRNRDGRGQNANRNSPRVRLHAFRQGLPHRDGQRIPCAARLRVDAPALLRPRAFVRFRLRGAVGGGQKTRLLGRHNLRHCRRIRLRLFARQLHDPIRRRKGAARILLLPCGRGRLRTCGRSPHAAHNFGRRRRSLGKPLRKNPAENTRARRRAEQAMRGNRRRSPRKNHESGRVRRVRLGENRAGKIRRAAQQNAQTHSKNGACQRRARKAPNRARHELGRIQKARNRRRAVLLR